MLKTFINNSYNSINKAGVLKWSLILFSIIFVIDKIAYLPPNSLYLDDEWVAVLIKFVSPLDFLDLAASSPIGFIMLQKVFFGLFQGSALSVHILPVICAVLTIVVGASAFYYYTKDTTASVFLAILLLISPLSNLFAIRVKQYTLDSLITCILLFLIFMVLNNRTKPAKYLTRLSAISILALFFSSFSIFLSFVAINSLGLGLFYQSQFSFTKNKKVLIICLTYNLLLAIIYFFYLSSRSNPEMFLYWQNYYLPLESFSKFYEFLKYNVRVLLQESLPPKLSWFLLGSLPGLIYLFKKDKGLILIVFGFFMSIFCASALSKFPIGSGRIDIFTHPITLMLISFGFLEISNFLKQYKYISEGFKFSIIIICLLSWIYREPLKYPPNHDAEFIERCYTEASPEDAIIAFPFANYALGYYGSGPVNVVPVNYSTNGIEVRPQRPHTYVIPEGVGAERFQNNPMIVKPFIENILNKNYSKVIYVSCYANAHSKVFRSVILDAGYVVSSDTTVLHNELYVFEKK